MPFYRGQNPLVVPQYASSFLGRGIWDSILISLGVYLHVGIFLKHRVLGGLGHRQSCLGWVVSGEIRCWYLVATMDTRVN
jgi:hypothetical protein